MSPEAQQIAIAEACGWTLCAHPKCRRYHDPKTNQPADLPDYLSDLNAMHEAEPNLTLWEAGFVEINLARSFFTDKQREVVAAFRDKYDVS